MKTASLTFYLRSLAGSSLVLSALVLFDFNLRGQGTVNFANGGLNGITNSLTGQRAEVGTIFSVALYFAPNGIIDEFQFAPLGRAVGLVSAGSFNGGIRTAPVFPSGSFGMFQVRAWETSFGSTYEEAVGNANPQNGRLALAGQSGIMRVDTGDPTIPEAIPPTPLGAGPPWVITVIGAPLADGFFLTVVPEPTAALLLLLGLPMLMVLRRR